MKAHLECLPCLGKNAVDAAMRSTTDEKLRLEIVAESLRLLADNDLSMPPPHTARQLLDIARKHTGVADVHLTEKRCSNYMAKRLVGELGNLPEYDPDSFASNLRLAVAGNILDFGIFADLDIAAALETVKAVMREPLDTAAVERLKRRMDAAKSILYILDNCGEAVFDGVFLKPYRDKVTLVVRGRPVLNDVTAADLADCGLDELGCRVIDNGPEGIPGVIPGRCGEVLERAMRECDLVIAKGQGNFETLSDVDVPIAFLFLAKCRVVAGELGVALNSIQVRTKNF